MNLDLPRILMFLVSFTIGITIHEFAHAVTAVGLGDDTPRRQGRISLNPLDHLDPLGTVVLVVLSIVGFGFGWGKPVQIDAARFKNPRLGDAIVSAAGPVSNLLLAVALAVVIRTGYFGIPYTSPYYSLIDIAFQVNVLLFVFNFIPIPPLDGSHILTDILPTNMADPYRKFMASWGWTLFIALLFFGFQWIQPAIDHVQAFLIGDRLLI